MGRAVQGPQFAAADNEVAFLDGYRLRVAPVCRIESQQVGKVFDVRQIVDRHELERGLVDRRFQDRASDSSQTIDGDSGGHCFLPSGRSPRLSGAGIRLQRVSHRA